VSAGGRTPLAQLGLEVVDDRVIADSAGAAGHAHGEQQRDEPRLDPVVQIALDRAAGAVGGVDEAAAGGA
jgi:hypothetical protein